MILRILYHTQFGILELDQTHWPLNGYLPFRSCFQLYFLSIWEVKTAKELKGLVNICITGLCNLEMVLQENCLFSLVFCNEQVSPSISHKTVPC